MNQCYWYVHDSRIDCYSIEIHELQYAFSHLEDTAHVVTLTHAANEPGNVFTDLDRVVVHGKSMLQPSPLRPPSSTTADETSTFLASPLFTSAIVVGPAS
jgi:hypothetical protein